MTLRSLALPVLCFTLGTALPAAPADTATQPAPVATTASPAPAKLLGRIADDRYFAPGDVYSVPVPVLQGEGSTIMDNGEIVVFKDKVSTLLTIAAFPLPPIAKWEYETTPPKDYLITFFRDNVLRDYRLEFPETTIESARFLPDVHGGTMVAFTLLPNGSAFQPAEPRAPTAPSAIAKRGHLVFVRDGRIFVIAVELAERVTAQAEYNLNQAQEDHILFNRLVTVITAMRFGQETAQPDGAPTDHVGSESNPHVQAPVPAGK